MKAIPAILLIAGLVFLAGCDGDGDDGQQTIAETTDNETQNENENQNETPEPETSLASGDATIGAGVGITLCTVYPPAAGTLRGTLTWSGAPSELVAVFNDDTTAYSQTEGASPVTSVLHVSVAGEPWRFCGGNNSGTNASVHYSVTFVAD